MSDLSESTRATIARLDEIASGEEPLCSACPRPADGMVKWPHAQEPQPYCNQCMQEYHAEADNTDADEMRKFGGAYGLCPRPTFEPFNAPSNDELAAAVRELSAALEAERNRSAIFRQEADELVERMVKAHARLTASEAEVARLRGELATHTAVCADVGQFYVDEVDYNALGENDGQ